MTQAVSGVARIKVMGSGLPPPWVQAPAMEVLSGESLPAKTPSMVGTATVMEEPSTVVLPGKPGPG